MTVPLLNNWLTVREARAALAMNGIEWQEIWIRTQISTGAIKSEKVKSMRLIPREEISRIIRDRKADK